MFAQVAPGASCERELAGRQRGPPRALPRLRLPPCLEMADSQAGSLSCQKIDLVAAEDIASGRNGNEIRPDNLSSNIQNYLWALEKKM